MTTTLPHSRRPLTGWLLSCEVGPRAWNFHKWLPALARLALYKPTQAGRRALLFRGEPNWVVRGGMVRGGRGVHGGKDKVEAPPTPILHVFMPLSLFRFVLCRVVFLGTKMHPWTRTLNWACVSGNLLPPTLPNPLGRHGTTASPLQTEKNIDQMGKDVLQNKSIS